MADSLPTPEEMLSAAESQMERAYRALTDAADWLRSDWRPIGTPLTAEQARRRSEMRKAIATAKTAINEAATATRPNPSDGSR
jgi:hypothetical protein